jgi:PAS domain S-box-containing protein
LPSILAIGLFIVSIFVFILPSFERNIMEVKKEMIGELTNTAWSLLEEYHHEVEKGNLPLDSAKELAAERIQEIRYGSEYKDYFWIIDMQPVMIMHPYRTELIGRSLTDYEDPGGKRLFAEAARIAETDKEGYIDYMWQWKDDSTRIVPKLSFVKAFEPWGWVIGTGIYLEDVREEIGLLKNRLLRIVLLITLIISILMGFIIRQSLNIENRRQKAENKLRLSRQKYKSLVEASTEGTLMIQKEEIIFSNIKFSELCGFDPFHLRKYRFDDLFEISWSEVIRAFSDPKKSISFETVLKCEEGNRKEVLVSVSQIPHAGQMGYVIIVKEIGSGEKLKKETEILSQELQTSLLLMDQPVKNFREEIRKCPARTSVREAASIMSRKEKNILFVSQDDEIIGVVNNNDLKKRVVSENVNLERPIVEFMTSPVQSVSEDAPVYEVLLKLKNREISHLLTVDSENRPRGVVGYENLFEFQQNVISFLIREIQQAENTGQIKSAYRRLPAVVTALIRSGAHTPNLTRVISSVNDTVHQRLIELAIEDLGEPPCRFAFMVLGSEGRKEQTLATDQDNAIIFENVKEEQRPAVKEYFLSLGRKVSRALHEAGYQYCRGEVMAMNPKWTHSLEEWKNQAGEWMQNSTAEDILEASIFFDFRAVYGEEDYIRELREHVNKVSENKAVFFYHMVQEVLKFKPPVNIFGNIVGNNNSEADELHVDIKRVIFPLVTFLRLYAMKERISETNSLERASQMFSGKLIDKELYDEITEGWSFLTHLRLKSQVNSLAANDSPGNRVNLNALTKLEQSTLKRVFSLVGELQTKVKFDFKSSE